MAKIEITYKQSRAPGGIQRTSISVPRDVYAKMKARNDVNWSGVATSAFRLVIEELAKTQLIHDLNGRIRTK